MHTPASSTQHHPAAPAAIAINSAQVASSVKSQRGKCDRPSIGPRAPRGKAARKAAAWRKFYADMAAWYDEKHQFFSKHDGSPFATFHCAGERDRFLEGVRQLDAGQHPNQIAGVWR